MNYGLPPISSALPVMDDNGRRIGWSTWPKPWGNWLSSSWIILNAAQASGLTADRPMKNLYPGMPYFDTSLGANGRPIWVDKTGVTWVFADGTAA